MHSVLKRAFEFTMAWEGEDGEVTDHPDDPGGRTRYGVTERDYPEVWADGPPTRGDALRIFEVDYYAHERVRADRIEDPDLAVYLADAAYNQGQPTAPKFLQRAIRVFGGDLGPAGVDGWVGSGTLRALRGLDVPSRRVLHAMVYYRVRHHVGLVEGEPDQYGAFLYGWLRRDYSILTGEEP